MAGEPSSALGAVPLLRVLFTRSVQEAGGAAGQTFPASRSLAFAAWRRDRRPLGRPIRRPPHSRAGKRTQSRRCPATAKKPKKTGERAHEGDHTSPEGPETAGSPSHAEEARFCATRRCVASFRSAQGDVVQRKDGVWSHSGGLEGACDRHGGER